MNLTTKMIWNNQFVVEAKLMYHMVACQVSIFPCLWSFFFTLLWCSCWTLSQSYLFLMKLFRSLCPLEFSTHIMYLWMHLLKIYLPIATKLHVTWWVNQMTTWIYDCAFFLESLKLTKESFEFLVFEINSCHLIMTNFKHLKSKNQLLNITMQIRVQLFPRAIQISFVSY